MQHYPPSASANSPHRREIPTPNFLSSYDTNLSTSFSVRSVERDSPSPSSRSDFNCNPPGNHTLILILVHIIAHTALKKLSAQRTTKRHKKEPLIHETDTITIIFDSLITMIVIPNYDGIHHSKADSSLDNIVTFLKQRWSGPYFH